jgi:hypothetical protein
MAVGEKITIWWKDGGEQTEYAYQIDRIEQLAGSSRGLFRLRPKPATHRTSKPRSLIECIAGEGRELWLVAAIGAIILAAWFSVFTTLLDMWLSEHSKWLVEALGLPFWLVFTKLFSLEITRAESLGAAIGIASIAHLVTRNFRPANTASSAVSKL